MAIVSDDERAVRSDQVLTATKTDDEQAEIYWVTVELSNGQAVNFRFASSGPCGDFFKTLVDAMTKDP